MSFILPGSAPPVAKAAPALWVNWFPAAWRTTLEAKLTLKGELSLLGSLTRMAGIAKAPLQHWAWMQTMQGEATRRLVNAYPRILFRYTLPYLASSIERAQRLDILKTHYRYINERLGKMVFDRVLDDRYCLWQQGVDGELLSIHLTGPCLKTLHREGELTLNFRLNGQTLYRLAFTIGPASAFALDGPQALPDEMLVLYVGQIQGTSGRFEAIRQATRLCSDVAPQDILMAALQGVMQAWRIDHVLGVSTQAHICADIVKQRGSGFDYDGFWTRYGAQRTSADHHWMRAPFGEKPLAEIAARHRGRTRIKRALKQALSLEVAHTLEHRIWKS